MSRGMILIVDDERTFKVERQVGPVVYCRSSQSALATLSHTWTRYWLGYTDPIQQLWLDHDLGESDTIRPVVEFIYLLSTTNKPLMINEIFVHTMNPSGGDSVLNLLHLCGTIVKRVPLPELV